MNSNAHSTDVHSIYSLTAHAWTRMHARRLSRTVVRRVIKYRRVVYIREATIYAVGRKEVAYRNRDFRGLRRRRPRARRRTW